MTHEDTAMQSTTPEDARARAAAIARAELVLASLEVTFRRKARHSVDEMRRVLDAIVPEDANRLGIENHARLARIAELAVDVAAQLGFFGDMGVADLAGKVSRRLERRDSWDMAALDAVGRQLDELGAMLGNHPDAPPGTM